jgi:hypothetical protein
MKIHWNPGTGTLLALLLSSWKALAGVDVLVDLMLNLHQPDGI